MSVAGLIIALIAPPSMAATVGGPSAPAHDPAAAADSWSGARLTLWGTQVRWDARWRAFVAHENPDRAVAPVWERFETPSTDIDRPAPSYIVMREMDCGRRVWRTMGMVRFTAANLKGEARFEASDAPWRTPGEAGAEVVSIYGSICRR